MKFLIGLIVLSYMGDNAYAGNTSYLVTCHLGDTIKQYDNVSYYSDDMMSYSLSIEKDGKTRKIRVPKNSCIVEEK